MEAFKKGDYIIDARYAYPGEYIENYLEGSDYETNDEKCIVLRGTVDEEWVVTFDKLMSTYTYADGRTIYEDDLGSVIEQGDANDGVWFGISPIQDAQAPIVWAEQTDPDEQVQVETSWGEILTANRPGIPHGDGDWIVYADDNGQPNFDDQWIVNGAVFETTYVPA